MLIHSSHTDHMKCMSYFVAALCRHICIHMAVAYCVWPVNSAPRSAAELMSKLRPSGFRRLAIALYAHAGVSYSTALVLMINILNANSKWNKLYRQDHYIKWVIPDLNVKNILLMRIKRNAQYQKLIAGFIHVVYRMLHWKHNLNYSWTPSRIKRRNHW
jgi:hypothetical protein